MLVALKTSYATAQAPGLDDNLLANVQRAVRERARDHSTEARYGEHAVNRQPWFSLVGTLLGVLKQRIDPMLQVVKALPGARGNGHDVSGFQGRALDVLAHLFLNEGQPFLVHQVALG